VDGVLTRVLSEISALGRDERLARRYDKFRTMGRLGTDFVDAGS
jgi:acetyl-CoA carboxylase alpha subunit